MRATTGVAGNRAISAGTLLIAGAVLALYQMTSLVLGPGGSRQLHLSLTIPAVDPNERAEWWTSGASLVLGTLASPAPAAPARARSAVAHRASSTPAAHPAPAPAQPVASLLPTTHPSAPPLPPIVRVPDPQSGVQQTDDTD